MIDQLRAMAVDLANEAGKIILRAGSGGQSAKSSPTDLVTAADHAAETYIFERLRRQRPDDSIVSEEGSHREGSSGISWVIDPLDGTINFIYGIPQWCVSIGIEGEVRAGVVHDPVKDETFTDADRLVTSAKINLEDSLIGTGFSYSSEIREKQAAILAKILPEVRDIRRAGSCALDLAWVACGRLDGFFEEGTNHWDVSAGIALVEAAGGSVYTKDSLTIAAGTKELLEKLKDLVLEASGG